MASVLYFKDCKRKRTYDDGVLRGEPIAVVTFDDDPEECFAVVLEKTGQLVNLPVSSGGYCFLPGERDTMFAWQKKA